MALRVVGKDFTPPKEGEPNPQALQSIADFFTQDPNLAALQRDEIEEFTLILRTGDSYMVLGSDPLYERLVTHLEEAKHCLVAMQVNGANIAQKYNQKDEEG